MHLEGKGCVDRIEVNVPGRYRTNLQTSSAGILFGVNYYGHILGPFICAFSFYS